MKTDVVGSAVKKHRHSFLCRPNAFILIQHLNSVLLSLRDEGKEFHRTVSNNPIHSLCNNQELSFAHCCKYNLSPRKMKGRDAPAGTGATTPDRNKGKFFGGMLGQGRDANSRKYPNLRSRDATERCVQAGPVKGRGEKREKHPNLTQILIERTC